MKSFLFILILLTSSTCLADDLTYAKKLSISSMAYSQQREFYVSLPESYSVMSKKTYPVLYLLHGQWDMLPAVATLELLGDEVPEFIIVGVDSRGKELHPGNSGIKQTPLYQFLHEELIPHIEDNYRIAPYKVLSGHSNSGRFVMHSWIQDGRRFSQYFAFSPSLEDGLINEQVNRMTDDHIALNSPLALTIANEGDHMQVPFESLRVKLAKQLKEKFLFKKLPNQTHSSSRHASLRFALKSTFSDWNPSYEIKTGGIEGLIRHYRVLSDRYGFEAQIPLDTLLRVSAYHAISNKDSDSENIRKIIVYAQEKYAQSADDFFEVIEFLIANEPAAADTLKNSICAIIRTHKKCDAIQNQQ